MSEGDGFRLGGPHSLGILGCMLPGAIIAIVLLAGFAGDDGSYIVPAENMIQVPPGAVYVGDNIECKSLFEGMLRYGSDQKLRICREGTWREIFVRP